MITIYLYGFSLLMAGLTWIISYFQVKKERSMKPIFLPFELQGSFVWADGIIFGPFWILVSLGFLIVQPADWSWLVIFFLVFWTIRSAGETIYWFLQQFNPRSQASRNFLRLKRLAQGDEYVASFLYQIIWQCVTIFCIFGLIIIIFYKF